MYVILVNWGLAQIPPTPILGATPLCILTNCRHISKPSLTTWHLPLAPTCSLSLLDITKRSKKDTWTTLRDKYEENRQLVCQGNLVNSFCNTTNIKNVFTTNTSQIHNAYLCSHLDMCWILLVSPSIIYTILLVRKHSVEISGVFYHLNITWKQFWRCWSFKTCHFCNLEDFEFWFLINFSLQKVALADFVLSSRIQKNDFT